ncbi:MAG: DUF2723 domain-containing protein [Candidatus Buchananbacteria bacterium]
MLKKFLSKKIRLNYLLFCLIFLVIGTVYLFTLAPSINKEDTGELVSAAYTLGIAHPSGYPLWVIIGHLFTFLPVGMIAWKINLVSAVFGSLTCAVLYLIIEKLTKNKLISLICALILAFSQTFWSQCLIAKFYPLNSFFVACLIYILCCWREKRQDKYLYWFSILYGLSLTNHTMSILLAPIYATFIILVDKSILKNPVKILKMFSLFLLGLSVYLYLFWRGGSQDAFVWAPVTNWQEFWYTISRKQYGDFAPFASELGKIGLTISFIAGLSYQFFLPTLFLAIFGIGLAWKKGKEYLILTAGIFLLNSLGIIYLRSFGWGEMIDYVYRVYYLPAYLVLMIWLGLALAYAYDFFLKTLADRKKLLAVIKIFFYLTLISLPVNFLLMNYQKVDQSRYWLGYDYAKNILNSLEPNSIYYFAYDFTLQGDTEIFDLAYFKTVEHLRPDVTIVSEQNFFRKDLKITLPDDYFRSNFDERRKKLLDIVLANANNRPVYTNFAITQSDTTQKVFSLSNSYAFKIFSSLAEAKKQNFSGQLYPLRSIDQINQSSDLTDRGLAAHYYYGLAHFFLTQGDNKLAETNLIKAFTLDPLPFSHEYRNFLNYRFEWKNYNK